MFGLKLEQIKELRNTKLGCFVTDVTGKDSTAVCERVCREIGRRGTRGKNGSWCQCGCGDRGVFWLLGSQGY